MIVLNRIAALISISGYLALLFPPMAYGGDDFKAIVGSKEIPPIGAYSYEPKRAIDLDINTAWCTKQKGGAWLKIVYKEPKQFSDIGILGGLAKSPIAYKNNARPRNIIISVDGKQITNVTLTDSREFHWVKFPNRQGKEIRFDIDAAYSGDKYADMCITELIDKPELVEAYRALVEAEQNISVELKPSEIKTRYGPFFSLTYSLSQGASNTFWTAISLRVSQGDERALRDLLDMYYYSSSILLKDSSDAELTEVLRGYIGEYLENHPDIALRVLKDDKQLARREIVNAYENLIANFAYDPKSGEITDSGYSGDLKRFGQELKRMHIN